MTDDKQQELADDLLKGARAIGAFLGVPPSAVYHIAKTKRMPIGKLGKDLFASKAKLRRAAAQLTSTP
jgi:hypothetical protein